MVSTDTDVMIQIPAHLHKNLSAVFVLASIEEFLNEFAVSWGSISLLAKSHVLVNRNGEIGGVRNREDLATAVVTTVDTGTRF
jgi:hypothetical protein